MFKVQGFEGSRVQAVLVPGSWFLVLAAPAFVLAGMVTLAAQSPATGLGRPATGEEIRNLGAAIAPDGGGLPDGSGTVAAGREVFAARCARCHGDKAQGDVGPA